LGSQGVLGNRIVKSLELEGHELFVGVRSNKPVDGNHNAFEISLEETSGLVHYFRKNRIEILIHCAWDTTSGVFWDSNLNLKYVSLSKLFFEKLHKTALSKIVFLSSSAVYHSNEGACDANHSLPQPSTLYGVSKLLVERSLEKFSNRFGLEFLNLRIFQVFSHKQRANYLFPAVTQAIMNNEQILIRNPNRRLDWISDRQVGEAVSIALRENLRGTFDVGSSMPRSNREFISIVEEVLGTTSSLVKFDTSETLDLESSLYVKPGTYFPSLDVFKKRDFKEELLNSIMELKS
jgi:UDP-glucose 4-epimerase